MHEFKAEGMSCGKCVKHVTEAVHEVDPAAKVEVDLAQGKVRVESAKAAEQLARAIEEAGYPVTSLSRT